MLPANPTVWQIGYFVMLFLVLRYVIIGGIAWIIWYAVNRKKWAYKKIQPFFPKGGDYFREIGYSLLTFVVFTAMIMVVFSPVLRPYTQVYGNISEYGWGYFVFTFIAMLFIHDTYFYWTHRLMHHPKLFKPMHLVHHRSTNPTPWASFSFQPTEAVIEFSVILIFIFCFPVHRAAILLFLVFMTVYNVYGHLGYEIFPKGFHRNFIGKWFNTSVNHNMHHKFFTGNYGLYFTFWDRIMGTVHPHYEENYEEVTGRKAVPVL